MGGTLYRLEGVTYQLSKEKLDAVLLTTMNSKVYTTSFPTLTETIIMLIKRIISGGQTGADMGGLIAGKELGIETGGFAPKGWATELGPKRELLESFGLVEHRDRGYPRRTFANVRDSDATLIVGTWDSRGSALTRGYCGGLFKPCHNQRFSPHNDHDNTIRPEDIKDMRAWLRFHKISTLNIAGNRESKNTGIEAFCTKFLIEVFSGKKVTYE